MRRISIGPNAMGYKLAEPPLNSTGRPLAPTGLAVDEQLLMRLEQAGVEAILVEDDAFAGLDQSASVSAKTVRLAEAVFQEAKKQITAGQDKPIRHAIFANLERELEEDVDDVPAEQATLVYPRNASQRDLAKAVNRASLSLRLATAVGMHRYRSEIAIAALVADFGTWLLPPDITANTGQLSADQRLIMQSHVEKSVSFLSADDRWSSVTRTAVMQHHERMDGSGYPRGLKGEEVHRAARVLAICDTYAAMLLERPGRKLFTPEEALEHILGEAGNEFEFEAVTAFYKMLPPYPVGTEIRLSSGEQAVVLQVPVQRKSRPRVRVFADAEGQRLSSYREIDLSDREYQAMTILGVIE